ncbi:fasciclin domain-containing protein [Formosa sp. PL04]|uniref:fasciclin domain-containing protein n=1 Tax=Formosa sp. PL04 TaxID=3081755 RepID=UPI002980E534|nr:fasciclin domain-containing protein [Formosa sp. PL04]MDW5287496.1 fasciclin domain-containing protein [Formosa sp. PL04]
MKTNLKYLVALFSLVLVVTSCDSDDDGVKVMEENNIVETAQETSDLSSLVSALIMADKEDDSDLVGTLSGDGPFTVFAPTNQAFTNLLNQLDGYNSLADFDTTEGRKMLATILQYHVVAGAAVMSNQLSDNQEISTVQGENLMVDLTNGVYIEDATDTSAMVTTANVEASNGVVHIINKVLLPQEIIDMLNGMTLVEIVVGNDDLSILEAAVIKAGLVETLNSAGPFTVFAPTNDAFVALLNALGDDYNSLDDFNTDEEMALLKNILLYHVIPSAVYAADLSETSVETAFAGNSINVIMSGDAYVIQDATGENANIIAADVMASNGVAHVIDRVLLPN